MGPRQEKFSSRDPQLVNRKIAVLGFAAVGKSALTNAFVNGTFNERYDPTIENTHHKIIRFRKVHFATDIVDTAGMVRYLFCFHWFIYICIYISDPIRLTPYISFLCLLFQDDYSRLSRNASVGVHGYILVFSVASKQSFERVPNINEALLNALGDAPDVPRVLVGSMKDLGELRQVMHSEGLELADSLGIPYLGKILLQKVYCIFWLVCFESLSC